MPIPKGHIFCVNGSGMQELVSELHPYVHCTGSLTVMFFGAPLIVKSVLIVLINVELSKQYWPVYVG
jgi:hypothetical protein